MFKNHFKIAWRNLSRNRSHSLINLLGLAIGIACCLLILIWVSDELSFDKWNEKADRTYRVTADINFGGAHKQYSVTPAPLGETLVADFPEVETAVRFRNYGGALVKRDVQNFNEENVIHCDPTIFEVFSLNLISGDPKTALVPPNTVVISKKMASKYFPNNDPIGKKLTFDNDQEYAITGIMENMSKNSHFYYDFLVSLTGGQEATNGLWGSNNFHTYYVLNEGTNVAAFEAKVFPHLLKQYLSPYIEQIMGKSYEELAAASGAFIKYNYQPLTDIHLKSDLVAELNPNGSIQYVWIFSAAALFILLIACVNFMNLSTARSSIRAKEIGVRKVLGSMRSNLVNQFLVESVLMTAIAFLIGITFAQFALPYYNNLADKQLTLPFDSIPFWGIALLSMLGIGLLAGSYPALYLSGFKPIKTLSGKFLEKGGNLSLRNGLVVFQFLIAVLLIIGTLVINRQMDFIQTKKMGFERDHLLIIDNVNPLGEKGFILKKELLNNPKITKATMSGYLPIPSYRSDSPVCKSQELNDENCIQTQMWNIDEDYLSTLGMELVAGRNFSPDMPTDSSAAIINETAALKLGFADPIGQKFYGDNGNFEPGVSLPMKTIIGVVKDFHFESLRQNIGAVTFYLNPHPSKLVLKVNSEDLPTLIAEIERNWKGLAAGQPFSYRFMDESFDQVYRSENRISSLFSIFSGLSIFIACLGLFGLAAFATERRTKEIGIRKVLGASTAGLVALLSKDFLKLVIVSLLIATPLAWYMMNRWLQNFAYSTTINWWIFAVASLGAIAVAFLTVSFQSIKAASANPIESLKTE
ncbi:MAG: putative ABC transport system permease protein [Paraglaciecola sp.]|jgi:putative ABC transport system permease protein